MKLLETHDAVILERIAMGAGATNWYYCKSTSQLGVIEAQLSPGSAVSVYFDDRIRNAFYSPAIKLEMENIIVRTGDVVLGLLCEDQLHVDVTFVDNARQLAEETSGIDSTSQIFYGAFPVRDNDGVRAVTVVLPDADGTVRPHPH